ncbi:PREDICTED: cytochrome b-c1 complex subunit 8 [Polistes dominula]|uniref:Cytochrome b-c1 complex subunit 8 n=1 Tax=Polistes dominula TaxID=743375 RepID=A0ABM1I090_POLDO|nr:PREDICTED: cytochrome b-c1 complex subunit 8 [Polistes dominula]XP_015173627.1 PREDICTED: cytochrome b-c1 complex subunit 8 [Polistes dominula]
MGLEFGNLYKLRRIVFFRLSPHEQKAFKGMISEGIPNTIRRFQSSVFFYAPILGLNYMVYLWAKDTDRKLTRKNPDLYKDDV